SVSQTTAQSTASVLPLRLPANGAAGRCAAPSIASSRYCSRPPEYSHSTSSSGFSTLSFTARPGHRTAFARSTCLRRETEIFGESKYCGSGQKRMVVPVLFLPTVPTTSSLPRFLPFTKLRLCSLPSRRIHTSRFFDSAFTTDTPTPCRPPEKR